MPAKVLPSSIYPLISSSVSLRLPPSFSRARLFAAVRPAPLAPSRSCPEFAWKRQCRRRQLNRWFLAYIRSIRTNIYGCEKFHAVEAYRIDYLKVTSTQSHSLPSRSSRSHRLLLLHSIEDLWCADELYSCELQNTVLEDGQILNVIDTPASTWEIRNLSSPS